MAATSTVGGVMMNKHVDCNKFSPNIFNKTKCQNCFRPKEVHSAEALESNRASRRVSKCGYLFVAPDWDFSVSINRSKRWQRRWFILFDDGELTYSVDEHPDTIPQAIIDVNLVLEVSDAEEVTGNKYAIAITAPEKVHFIKGTSQEESKRWFDILSMFPRSMRGRQKRNATFPGIKATTVNQYKDSNQSSGQESVPSRTRYLSCQSGDKSADIKENVPPSWSKDPVDKVYQNDPLESSTVVTENVTTKLDEGINNNDQVPPSNVNKFESNEAVQPSAKSRRYILRQTRGSRSQRSKSDGIAKMFPLALDRPKWVDDLDSYCTSSNQPEELLDSILTDFNHQNSSPTPEDKEFEKIFDEMNLDALQNQKNKKNSNLMEKSISVDSIIPPPFNPKNARSERHKQKLTRMNSKSRHSVQQVYSHEDKPSSRGVPDGCGNDTETGSHRSTCANLDISSDDVEKSKKGWLMKLDSTQEWSRHWFVLRGTALMFYRDPTCEEKGILDGFIDLGLIQKIEEVDLTKYYGFRITMWDNNQCIFSAGSLSLRNSWLIALAQVSNPDSKKSQFDIKSSQAYASLDKATKGFTNLNNSKDNGTESNDLTSKSQASIPQIKKTKSFDSSFVGNKCVEPPVSWVGKNNSVLISENRALPPSPPVTRTPISKVKEKARSRSSSRSRGSGRRSKSTSSPILMSDETDGSPTNVRVTELKSPRFSPKFTDDDKKGMSNGDIVLVDLLETEVESLRTRLEDAQKELVVLHQTNLDLQNKSPTHKGNTSKSENWNEGCVSGECGSIIQSLSDECQRLRNDGNNLREDVNKFHSENAKLKKDQEELSRIRDDITDLKSQCNWKEIVIQRQRSETQSLKKNLDNGKEEIKNLFNKLNKFNKDKNVLTVEIHDLESKLELVDNQQKDSPLVITEDFEKESEAEMMKNQLTKTQSEVRSLKKELRQAHCSYDELELYTMKMKHDMDAVRQENQSDSRMMAERIEDLTSKLSSAERTTRQLKQKLAKAENRQERRSRSLRGGKESLTISKEMEAKLSELEKKMKTIEGSLSLGSAEDESEISVPAQSDNKDSANIFLRLNLLNSKVSSAVQLVDSELENAPLVKCANESQSVSKMLSDSTITSNNQKPSSDSIIQQLKMRLKYTENIMEACKQKLNEVVRRIPCIECQCACKNSLSELKEDLAAIYEVILGQCSSESETNKASQLCSAVCKMRKLLHSQTKQICNQRRKLKAAGMHSIEVEKKLMAEKLALETAVMKYMTCVIHSPEHNENTVTFWMSELQNFSASLEEVDAMMNSTSGKKMFIIIKRVLKLVLCSPVQSDADSISKTVYSTENSPAMELHEQSYTMENVKLKVETLRTQCSEMQKTLDEIYLRKIHVIIESFLDNSDRNVQSPSHNSQSVKELVNTVKSYESWDAAKDVVNHNIVKSEMQNLMSKFARVYRDCIDNDSANSSCWCMTEFQNVFLSRKQSDILSHLDEEINKATGLFAPEISQVLSSSLKSLSGNLSKESCDMLEEAVAIITFKAVICGYLSSIEAFIFKSFSMEGLQVQNNEGMGEHIEGLIQSILTNAELSFILNQAQLSQLEDSTHHQSQMNVMNVKESYESMLQSERDMFINVVDNLQGQISKLEERKAQIKCLKCMQNQGNLQKIVDKHQNELAALKNQYNGEKKTFEDKYQELQQQKENENVKEVSSLQKQLAEQTKQLQNLEKQYEDQIKILKNNFEGELSQHLHSNMNNDLHRQQYEAEIEQLKELCKMGFSAMEKCHKHVIKDMEDRHNVQLENLRSEQERALADETQATIAALDAIKKAHETEIQKKLALVKEEYEQSSTTNTSSGVSYPSNELDTIKEEIKSISDKLSSAKTDESAVQGKVDLLTRQLVEANSEIFELKARNNQLRTYLSCKTNELKESSDETTECKQLQKLLEINTGELLKKDEELVEIKRGLESLKIREMKLQEQCGQLQENLKVKRKLKEDEMKNFLHKLEAVSTHSVKKTEGNEQSNMQSMPALRRPIDFSDQKFRRPFKNLSFTYKRDMKGSSSGLLTDTVTLKSDV